MAPLPFAEYTSGEREILLRIARESIVRGCEQEDPWRDPTLIGPALTNKNLAAARNCFVTLTKRGALRGCIGSLAPSQPLSLDVAHNAFNSAFRDPRFPAVVIEEVEHVDIQIAVLSPQRPIEISSETALLDQLQPHVDGLTIEDSFRRATFLPKVWESLPLPRDFLTALKLKAGMPADHWSQDIKVYRYHAENFAESEQFATGA